MVLGFELNTSIYYNTEQLECICVDWILDFKSTLTLSFVRADRLSSRLLNANTVVSCDRKLQVAVNEFGVY